MWDDPCVTVAAGPGFDVDTSSTTLYRPAAPCLHNCSDKQYSNIFFTKTVKNIKLINSYKKLIDQNLNS